MNNTERGQAAAATPFMTVEEAAAFLRVSKAYLNKARLRGDGPPFLKIGSRVIYRQLEIEQWAATHRRQSTSELGVAA